MEQYADKSFCLWLVDATLFMGVAQHGHQGPPAQARAVAQPALFSRALPVSIHFDVI